MRKMKELHVQLMFMLTALVINGIHGEVTPAVDTTVLLGDNVELTCTSTETNPTFTWTYVTESQALYIGTTRGTTAPRYDNIVLQEGTDTQTSILNINGIQLEEDGEYLCSTIATITPPSNTMVTVEVASESQPIDLININNFANYMYQATCDAIGSKPEETITWILDGVTQTDGIVETDPGTSSDPLFDLRSVFTFNATLENYNVTLTCRTGGHLLDSLNREESRRVDVQNPPASDGVVVGFNSGGTQLTIACNTNDAVEPAIPPMSNFYIYDSNNTLIHMSTNSENSVTVPEPDQETEYRCVGGNYLGNTSEASNTYDPTSTTTPIPTTASESTEPVVGPNGTSGQRTGPTSLGAGAIAGIVIGALLVIIIIVVIIVFVLKPDCVSGLGSSSGGGGGPKKHAGSSVGSSNGNDKDNFKPTPQPRQSSIKHTSENPGMAEYAMVDRKPKASSGGDMPDTRGNGAGQNEQPGMHYADLDLTPGAGHTEEKVPQNPDNVVVYSSILV